MSTAVSLIRKKPMKMTLAVHEVQTKTANSAFLAEAMVRVSHGQVRLMNLAFGAQPRVLAPQ